MDCGATVVVRSMLEGGRTAKLTVRAFMPQRAATTKVKMYRVQVLSFSLSSKDTELSFFPMAISIEDATSKENPTDKVSTSGTLEPSSKESLKMV